MKEHIIRINTQDCIGCGLCKNDCPVNNIFIENKKASLKSQNCIKCAHCAAICPKKAVSISGFSDAPIEFDKQTILNPDQLLEAIQMRRSIRQFLDKPVPSDVIDKIIEAGRWTPTAKNAQDISYIVLKDEKVKFESIAISFFKKLLPIVRIFYSSSKNVAIDENFFFKKAPLAIVIISNDKISASLAASNMALMAEACGLGVLYSGFFTIAVNLSKNLRKALKLNRKNKAVTTIVLGYPNVSYHRTAQKENAMVNIM